MPGSIPIPPRFLERMAPLLGDEFPAFKESLLQEPAHSLRVNTLKVSPQAFQALSPFPLGEVVPWCPSAFILPPAATTAAEPGKHPFHLAGLYYLQDPSAMAAAELLDAQPAENVLDLTAAPGGKTTLLAARMQGKGLLLANEIKNSRINHLLVNLVRWGSGIVAVSNETPERLSAHFGAFFDRVLVDAPCSGEGMFRKDGGARLDWSERMVAGCAQRQAGILRVAARLVKPGGRLLYSTCTFNPEENEGIILGFLQEHPDFEVLPLPLQNGFMPGRPDWLEGAGTGKRLLESVRGAVRLFPHRLHGDGAFACLLQNQGAAAPAGFYPREIQRIPPSDERAWQTFREQTLAMDFDPRRLLLQGSRLYLAAENLPELRGLRVTMPGVWLGTFHKGRFEPAHPLALFLGREQARSSLSLASISHEVRAYLRGECLPAPGEPGWALIEVDGWSLGWGKRVQGVMKNHYPRGWVRFSGDPV